MSNEPLVPGEVPAPTLPIEPVAIAKADPSVSAPTKSVPASNDPVLPPSREQLRRQLDADIEAELAEAMSQFDSPGVMESTRGPAVPASRPVTGAPVSPGPERIAVRVIDVRGDSVYVDLGQKSEGIVPVLQFEGKPPRAGDTIDVVVDRHDPRTDTYLARLPGAAQEADWGSVAKGMIVDAQVKKVNKGGLEVTVNGIRGFLPAGQVDIGHVADLSTLVGHTLRCEVTEANVSDRNLVVSRRVVVERERAERAQLTIASLQEGMILDGTVKSVKDYGAFVDIGGIDGLVHISQLSWSRVKHPSEVLSPGQQVKVAFLKRDEQTGKISLGLRQLTASPWSRAGETYHSGQIVRGTVTRLAEFGAFVEIEPGIEGLVHVSELSPNRVRRVFDIVQVGQVIDVKILDIDTESQRISLSLKQAAPEPEPEPIEEPATATESSSEPEPAVPAAKKPSRPLKGGLGSTAGPMFGG